MDKSKWLKTMEIYDEYERRFAEARTGKSFHVPSSESDKAEIVEKVKKMLAFKDSMIPSIGELEEVSRITHGTYDVVQLRYETWENFYSAASLYLPHGKEKAPLAFVFCGHGKNGRLTRGYVSMANRLAKMGIAVIVPDNIGQGSRSVQGHWEVIAPFYCGLTLQGMILMESVALIRRMASDPRFDSSKMFACGNSGGGTLCVLLAALAPELSMLSASGYPSEFSYLLAKERKHCACNLLPGCANAPDMWEILSVFAPKPLFIEQGINDNLIPDDLFLRTARKVKHTYLQADAENNFSYALAQTLHPWVNADRELIANFFASNLDLPEAKDENDEDEELIALSENWNVFPPDGSLDVEQLAQKLTGKTMPKDTTLDKIFVPTYNQKEISPDDIISDIGRGDVMRILAQMECALKK